MTRAQPSVADYIVRWEVIGCEFPEPCPWEGVTVVRNIASGREWRACREHSAPFRKPLFEAREPLTAEQREYHVIDSGANNHKLIPDGLPTSQFQYMARQA